MSWRSKLYSRRGSMSPVLGVLAQKQKFIETQGLTWGSRGHESYPLGPHTRVLVLGPGGPRTEGRFEGVTYFHGRKERPKDVVIWKQVPISRVDSGLEHVGYAKQVGYLGVVAFF